MLSLLINSVSETSALGEILQRIDATMDNILYDPDLKNSQVLLKALKWR